MKCKDCNKNKCNDLNGNFDCLGLPNQTTIEDVINRANELLCTDCIRPTIEVESDCDSRDLLVTLTDKGSADKVSIEIYQGKDIYKTLRVTSLGTTSFRVPFGDYRIRAFDTYNFECSGGYINYSHQCAGEECISPIVSVTSINNPSTLIVNLISLGDSNTVDVRIYKDSTLVSSNTLTTINTIRFPASSGTYKVVVVGKCANGETYDEFTIRIVDNNCDIFVANLNYDCDSKRVSLSITGGSTEYEYSLTGTNWVSNINQLAFENNKLYGLYIRDKNNTTCFTYHQFTTNCTCQLSLTVTEIQCNVLDCILTLTYSEAQCTNTLICTINGSIQITT